VTISTVAPRCDIVGAQGQPHVFLVRTPSDRLVDYHTDRKKAFPVGGYSRVTVSGPQRWADLALPGSVPVATLMPRILEVCLPEKEGSEAAGWSLTTSEDEILPLEESLETFGVDDGDVLFLKREVAPARPQYVDDVRGAVEDRVDENEGFWTHSVTFGFGLLCAALLPLLVLACMSWLRPSAVHLVSAVLGLVISLPLVIVARRRSMHTIAQVLFGVTALWGAAMGALLVYFASGEADPQNMLLLGLVGALVASGVAWTVDEAGLPWLAMLAFICLGGGVLMVITFFLGLEQGVRGIALLLVLSVGGLPRLALVMGGLSALDYRVVNSGGVPTEHFEETLDTSDRLLLGVVLGVAISTGATVPLLLWMGEGTPDRLLAAGVVLLMILRSRLFARIRHVLPLRLGGTLGVALCLVHLSQMVPAIAVWVPMMALALGAVVAALSWIKLGDVTQASTSRVLNWVEFALVVVAFVAVAWGAGLFEFVADMTS